ncbi:MAG: hypothetical protein ACRD2W_10370 [Acidimicrobiales bacterium]
MEFIRWPSGRGPTAMQRSLRRRRRALVVLIAAAFLTFAAALVASRPAMWGIQILADVFLFGYLGLLVHLRNVSAGVEMSNRTLGR